MKKTLLAISITSQLFMPATGTILHPNDVYHPEVEFGGTIKIKPTAWEWTTPTTSLTDINLSEATNTQVSGGITSWKNILDPGSITILEGRLRLATRKGSTGIFPTINVNGVDVGGTHTTKIDAFITPDGGAKTKIGELDITLSNRLVIAYYNNRDVMYNIASTYGTTASENDISTITTGNPEFDGHDHYSTDYAQLFAAIETTMLKPNVHSIVGYDDLEITNITLNAITKDLSAGTWSATLPITVSLQ